MNILPWRKVQADPLRGIVLENLRRLKTVFDARGKRLPFDAAWPTDRLERLLWQVIEVHSADLCLTFSPDMPAEHRISAIIRQLPPLARQGQWPGWIQTAR